MTSRPHVLVLGAGIIGASIALYLLRAGVRVTIVEAGSRAAATRNSFTWINATSGNPERYFRLRVRAMEEWHNLERMVPNLRVAWSGSLSSELPPDQLPRFAEEHASWGYEARNVVFQPTLVVGDSRTPYRG
jgi:glycine/D-amino acid oxidase-like deaminating enzyme